MMDMRYVLIYHIRRILRVMPTSACNMITMYRCTTLIGCAELGKGPGGSRPCLQFRSWKKSRGSSRSLGALFSIPRSASLGGPFGPDCRPHRRSKTLQGASKRCLGSEDGQTVIFGRCTVRNHCFERARDTLEHPKNKPPWVALPGPVARWHPPFRGRVFMGLWR